MLWKLKCDNKVQKDPIKLTGEKYFFFYVGGIDWIFLFLLFVTDVLPSKFILDNLGISAIALYTLLPIIVEILHLVGI